VINIDAELQACHTGSHYATCDQTPAKAGTQFTYPGEMEG